ncbi:hypothetical protein K7X08_021544 [Anisodus acutangulus]|uniref:Uncharacterized protein n=1 Tax=Anisodus acutangulus TaxID=402998 RepID=A0A9Q1RDG2_9SOLA|nr:hypothetical protein K7X08_021544 [Anisodus acutangulus]
MEILLPNLSQLPAQFHTTNGLPPHLMNTLKRAFLMAKLDYFTILDTLKPDLIIYDFLQPCIPVMAATLLIPAVLFLTPGAASNSYLHHGRVNNPSLEYPFSEIFFLDHENRKNKRMFDSLENDGIDEKNGTTRDEERNIGKEEVVKIVKQVLLEQSGERLREKAKEFSEIMRANGENDIDKVVEELLNLCKETIRHRYKLG